MHYHVRPSSLLTTLLAVCATFPHSLAFAETPKVEEIPVSAQRPVVIQLDAKGLSKQVANIPQVQLPEGYTFSVAAAAPLVTHPTMGCLDDKGRLFVCDAVGVNWNDKF